MLFYSDLHIYNANAQPATVHSDMLTLYAYQDELYYVNDANVHHKVITDQDLANPLAFSGGLLSLNYNTTNLKLTSNQLDTIQGISTAASPTFSSLFITSTSVASITLTTSSSDTLGSALSLSKINNAYYALSGDQIGKIIFNSVNAVGVQFEVKAAQNISSGNRGMTLAISSAATGTSTLVERFAITAAGGVRFHNAYTFPSTDGTAGQALVTNGSGTLSWTTISGSSLWSWSSMVPGYYLLPNTSGHINAGLFSYDDADNSNFAFFRARSGGSDLTGDESIGITEYYGTYASSVLKYAATAVQFKVLGDLSWSEFFLYTNTKTASGSLVNVEGFFVNHEEAKIHGTKFKINTQYIYKTSSNPFYLPYNAQSAKTIYYSNQNNEPHWTSLSALITNALGTPATGSLIYFNGTNWVINVPASAPTNGHVYTWSSSGPVWSAGGSFSSPLTSKGDLLIHDGTNHDRFPVGSDGYVPIADSDQTLGIKWSDPEWDKQVRSINDQSGTSYTLALSDAGAYVRCLNSAAITVTVPAESTTNFPIKTVISIEQKGAGQITVAAGSGVTINKYGGLKTAGQYAVMQLIKVASDTWTCIGGVS